MDTTTKALDHLVAHNIRPSMQRMLVMQYLMDHKTHPTVDEIYLALSPQSPTLSKTTVYNTLKLFLNNGAIHALTIDEKNLRYDADISDHAHFRCKVCDKLYDFVQPEVTGDNIQKGFWIEACHVYYKGICPNCLRKDGFIK